MDTIEKFNEWRSQQNISYGAAANIFGVDKRTFAQVLKFQRKCPLEIEDKIERFVRKTT